MEFWGIEVKPGVAVKVQLGSADVLHLSNACLGEVKKNKEFQRSHIFLNVNDQKLVIGTLSPEKPQISYDLNIPEDFELSHSWKNGSIYFTGYRSFMSDDSEEDHTDCNHEAGCDHPVAAKDNGKPELKNEKSNLSTLSKVTIVEPNKDDGSEDDSDFDEDDDSDGNESDERQMDSSDDDEDSSDDDDESSDEADEDTPKKGNKRPAQSASKTPIPEKKAKLVTPQKTGPEGKKVGGHTATPHPSKKAGKTSLNNDNSKQKTPKSSGQIPCKSCSKTFNSDTALQSHTKAKHSEDK